MHFTLRISRWGLHGPSRPCSAPTASLAPPSPVTHSAPTPLSRLASRSPPPLVPPGTWCSRCLCLGCSFLVLIPAPSSSSSWTVTSGNYLSSQLFPSPPDGKRCGSEHYRSSPSPPSSRPGTTSGSRLVVVGRAARCPPKSVLFPVGIGVELHIPGVQLDTITSFPRG